MTQEQFDSRLEQCRTRALILAQHQPNANGSTLLGSRIADLRLRLVSRRLKPAWDLRGEWDFRVRHEGKLA